jgi:hypothetical protein
MIFRTRQEAGGQVNRSVSGAASEAASGFAAKRVKWTTASSPPTNTPAMRRRSGPRTNRVAWPDTGEDATLFFMAYSVTAGDRLRGHRSPGPARVLRAARVSKRPEDRDCGVPRNRSLTVAALWAGSRLPRKS